MLIIIPRGGTGMQCVLSYLFMSLSFTPTITFLQTKKIRVTPHSLTTLRNISKYISSSLRYSPISPLSPMGSLMSLCRNYLTTTVELRAATNFMSTKTNHLFIHCTYLHIQQTLPLMSESHMNSPITHFYD